MGDTCVMCGAPVPEGRQVCYKCESKCRERDSLYDSISAALTDYEQFGSSKSRDFLNEFYDLLVKVQSAMAHSAI